jgi:hypothetical protein
MTGADNPVGLKLKFPLTSVMALNVLPLPSLIETVVLPMARPLATVPLTMEIAELLPHAAIRMLTVEATVHCRKTHPNFFIRYPPKFEITQPNQGIKML